MNPSRAKKKSRVGWIRTVLVNRLTGSKRSTWGLGVRGDPGPERVRSLDLTVFAAPEEGGGHHEPGNGRGRETEVTQNPTTSSGPREKREDREEIMFVLILRVEFVDMAELILKDNMEAERRRMQVDGEGMQHFQGRPARREIPDIISWVQCFGLYAAVVTSHYPEKIRELLTYQTMIVSEARRLGDAGGCSTTPSSGSKSPPSRLSISPESISPSMPLPFWHMGEVGDRRSAWTA